MWLAWVEVRDFRNYREVSLQVPPGLTAAVGANAQGKTNLLEAIYYLCALESPRISTDLPLVRTGATSAFLRGQAQSLSGSSLLEVEIRSGGQNRLLVNRSPIRRRRDLWGHVRAVFGGPEDLRLVLGGPEGRREFMDNAIRLLWPMRGSLATSYERVLRQRNRLLKEWTGSGIPPAMEAWDEELVSRGSALTVARADAVDAIRESAAEEFAGLSRGSNDALIVQYRPSVDGPQPEEAFRARLRDRRSDELLRRSTLVGPHRDELLLVVTGLTARAFASHGEAWGAALSLRLALARAVAAETGENPVLLLDDPFSGLDPERRERVAGSLRGRGQVVIAVPDAGHVPEGAGTWSVTGGEIVRG